MEEKEQGGWCFLFRGCLGDADLPCSRIGWHDSGPDLIDGVCMPRFVDKMEVHERITGFGRR